MAFRNLSLTVDDGIARIVLDRPTRRNALSLELLQELSMVLAEIGRDQAARVVVISGAGTDFSAGHDLGEMLDRPVEFYNGLFATCTEVMLRIQRLPQPVIAQVHGTATAAGCQLVAACDLAVAEETARFATPGVKIGLFCSTPMVPLSRAIGRKRALQMLLTGDFIDAATAQQWGLINEVTAEPSSRATELAQQVMGFSPAVIALGKQAFYEQIDKADVDAYAAATPVITGNAALPQAQEGMRAFLEKRRPIWPDVDHR